MLRLSKLKYRLGVGLFLLYLGAEASIAPLAADTSVAGGPVEVEQLSCLDPVAAASASFLAEKVSLDLRDVTVLDVMSALQDKFGLPISFIQVPQATSRITIQLERVPVADVMDRMLAQATPSYRCSVVQGHVIVYPDQEIYLQAVSGVSITAEPRSIAVRRYLDGLEAEGLQGIAFFAGGVLESDMMSETVSLEPEASFIEHLAQILGANGSTFFVIRDSPGGARYLTLGAVRPRRQG